MAEILLGVVGLLTLVGGVLGVMAIVEMVRSPYKS
ncbi:hypothetical protein SAMN05216554_1591 [Herbiconiux ginsengi]|uniref:Uncharacterized protein n=1 Tax=Herbiconiux ginsengi TaxID=381665 RepID=A0A1H3MWM9_9MICO|nr:hypothetical protein SAMN05216554_1591 [Herbiconiux ginsengi]